MNLFSFFKSKKVENEVEKEEEFVLDEESPFLVDKIIEAMKTNTTNWSENQFMLVSNDAEGNLRVYKDYHGCRRYGSFYIEGVRFKTSKENIQRIFDVWRDILIEREKLSIQKEMQAKKNILQKYGYQKE